MDSTGRRQVCTIYDYKNIFPLLENNGCEHWKDYFGLDIEDEDSLGPKTKFHKILVYGELVCVRQEYIEYHITASPGDQNFCFTLDEEKDISLEECS